MNPEQSVALSGPLANVPRHPKTAVADLETALNILEKHADKIPPVKVCCVALQSLSSRIYRPANDREETYLRSQMIQRLK